VSSNRESALQALLREQQLPKAYLQTAVRWFDPVAQDVAARHRSGQPLLVGLNGSQRSLGRLKYNSYVVIELEPGSYKLDTSLADSEALEVQLNAGATYYVHASVKKIGRSITPSLVLVEEQVAVAQKPGITGAI